MIGRPAALATLVAAGLLLTACSKDTNGPSVLTPITSSPSTSTTPSPGATSSASAMPAASGPSTSALVPTVTPSAVANNAPDVPAVEGGTLTAVQWAQVEASARRWYAALSAAQQSMDPAPLDGVYADSCALCAAARTQITEGQKAGDVLTGGTYNVTRLQLAAEGSELAYVQVELVIDAAVLTKTDGSEPISYAASPLTAEVAIELSSGNWLVADLARLDA